MDPELGMFGCALLQQFIDPGVLRSMVGVGPPLDHNLYFPTLAHQVVLHALEGGLVFEQRHFVAAGISPQPDQLFAVMLVVVQEGLEPYIEARVSMFIKLIEKALLAGQFLADQERIECGIEITAPFEGQARVPVRILPLDIHAKLCFFVKIVLKASVIGMAFGVEGG